MKKKLAVLLGVLVLSSISFAAPAKAGKAAGGSIESSLSNLENQLEKLQQMEDAKFRQQEAQANEAAQRLNNYTAMQAKIEAAADSKAFKAQYSELVKQYKAVVKALDSEIKTLSTRVENFAAIEALKGN